MLILSADLIQLKTGCQFIVSVDSENMELVNAVVVNCTVTCDTLDGISRSYDVLCTGSRVSIDSNTCAVCLPRQNYNSDRN